MIDLNLKYQTILFGSFEDIAPTPDVLKFLAETFSQRGLIPATFQELGPSGVSNRVSLRSVDNSSMTVEFSTTRIDISRTNSTWQENDMEDLESFIWTAVDIAETITEKFPKKFNRLALVTHQFLKETSEEEMNAMYHRLFKPIDIYKGVNLTEWNNRSVTRRPIKVLDEDEECNIISEVNRVHGAIRVNSQIKPINRVELKFDINTYQNNSNYRFNLEGATSFFTNAAAFRRKMEKDYCDLISVSV